MSRPTVDQASKQNFVVNIQDSEFGKLVVRWRERDINIENLSAAYHKVSRIPEFRITKINLRIMNTFQNTIASQLMQNQSWVDITWKLINLEMTVANKFVRKNILHKVCSEKKLTTFVFGHFTTISGHCFANYTNIFHKV